MKNNIVASIGHVVQQFILFISTPNGVALTIIIAIVLVAITLITYVSSKRNSYDKIIQNLEQEFCNADDGTVSEKLNRMKVIGQSNVVYSRAYEEHQLLYDQLKQQHKEGVQKEIEHAKQALLAKKYRLVNRSIKESRSLIEVFHKRLQEFYQQVYELTKQDEDLRRQESEAREEFKQCREIFTNHQQDLTLVEEEIAERISNINDKFDLYEQQLNRGNYEDAADYLNSLTKDVHFLYAILQDLPRFCQIATKYFPPKVNQIIEDVNHMQAEGYALHHITPGSQINKIKEELTFGIEKTREFNFEGLDEIFRSIDEKINDLKQKIESEKEAKRGFDSNFMKLYARAEELEKSFIRYMGEINELNRIYDISKQASEFSGRIKQQVNQLSVTRRALDSLNYSKQPYLMRYHKMQEMEQLALSLEGMLENFKKEVTNMKVISEDAHDLVGEAATKLKNLELKIRNFNLEKLNSKYVRDFNEGYELINKLNKAISASPIMIKLVDDLKAKLDELLRKTDERVNRDISFGRHSEKIIMYANNYRSSFSDVESSVSKAELLFFDARFEEAVAIVSNSIKKLGNLPFKEPVIKGE